MRGNKMEGQEGMVGGRERRATLGSLDSVEVAKEDIRRNEVLGARSEKEGGEKKKGGIMFPPMVKGAFEGRGLEGAGRL